MLILAVDTSTRTGSTAILRDSEVLAEVSGYEETPYSSRLFRDIALLQDRANFRLDQVDVFAVAAGPGSFTGLEAIAAEYLAGEAPGASNPRFVAPFLDARRGQIFGAICQRIPGDGMGLALASDESILSLDEFLELVKGKSPQLVQLVSPTPEVLPTSLLSEVLPGARIVQVSAALAPAIGRLGFQRAKRGDLVDSLRLDANYVRRSDAESAWKDG
jgi:tRNA threonylcarbamoyladenosine biosynthesis protein TsaB